MNSEAPAGSASRSMPATMHVRSFRRLCRAGGVLERRLHDLTFGCHRLVASRCGPGHGGRHARALPGRDDTSGTPTSPPTGSESPLIAWQAFCSVIRTGRAVSGNKLGTSRPAGIVVVVEVLVRVVETIGLEPTTPCLQSVVETVRRTSAR